MEILLAPGHLDYSVFSGFDDSRNYVFTVHLQTPVSSIMHDAQLIIDKLND